jgi:hypothetical protein
MKSQPLAPSLGSQHHASPLPRPMPTPPLVEQQSAAAATPMRLPAWGSRFTQPRCTAQSHRISPRRMQHVRRNTVGSGPSVVSITERWSPCLVVSSSSTLSLSLSLLLSHFTGAAPGQDLGHRRLWAWALRSREWQATTGSFKIF